MSGAIFAGRKDQKALDWTAATSAISAALLASFVEVVEAFAIELAGPALLMENALRRARKL